MVVLVPLKRCGIALDRIGDKDCRLVIGHGIKRIQNRFHAMPAQIGHQVMQGIIIIIAQQTCQRIIARHIAKDLFAPCRTPLERQGGIDIIWRLVQPFFQ